MILANTIALVLCGGTSTRMGSDKSMLQYYDKPQRYHVYDMLQPFAQQVFISCNAGQANTIEAGYQSLTDLTMYAHTGPMAALLTAFTRFPQKSILMIGCDYPFLSVSELINFSTCCTDAPISFYNNEKELYDPLLAWYPATASETIQEMHAAAHFSLQEFLQESRAAKYYPANKHCSTSVDTPEEFKRSKKLITGVY